MIMPSLYLRFLPAMLSISKESKVNVPSVSARVLPKGIVEPRN
jgi:hypothetical protein